MVLLVALLFVVPGCSDDDTVTADSKVGTGDMGAKDGAVGCVSGSCWDYVVNKVLLPLDKTTSDKYAFKVGGKGFNNLGTLLTTLKPTLKDTDMQANFDDQVCMGKNLVLMRLLAKALGNAASATLKSWTAAKTQCCTGTTCYDKTAKACVAASNTTCFGGNGAFTTANKAANLSGSISAGNLKAGPTAMTLLVAAEAATLNIPLVGVSVTGTVSAGKISDGILNGAIPVAQVSGLYAPLAKIINAEIKNSTTTTAALIKGMLDTDKDGTITGKDLSTNAVLSAMVKGDVKVKDSTGKEVDAISLGVGFTAVKAKITVK